MLSTATLVRQLGYAFEKAMGLKAPVHLTAEARPSTGSGRGELAEPRRTRSKEFLIKKYSELCELLPCEIPGCNSTGRVSLWGILFHSKAGRTQISFWVVVPNARLTS